ncbi:AAA family ATPase [Cylindrospermopsis raciborskii DSH]|uniref:AAA family ATPase n=1 Tax=Cylindrospermopsis raciborskii TaxID=77022 RepID=UPI002EDBA1E0
MPTSSSLSRLGSPNSQSRFSVGLNQLPTLPSVGTFLTICGYTQEDLTNLLAQHSEGVDWDELRLWYNGYSWRGESVYNPYDIFTFIREGMEYGNYWFETGTPTFLIRLFQTNRYFLPTWTEATEEILKVLENRTNRSSYPLAVPIRVYLTIERTFTCH